MKSRAALAHKSEQLTPSPRELFAQAYLVLWSSCAFPRSRFVYLLRPPPPPRDPMLEEPRELLARAALPLLLLDPPPRASPRELEPVLGDTLRFPTRSAPLPDEERFPPPELRSLTRACCPPGWPWLERPPDWPLFPAFA